MPALSLSDIADRRYRLAGHQAADAGLVSRHASAGSRQEGPVQHRTGSPARDLDQRRLADPAQADAGDDRTGPPLHAATTVAQLSSLVTSSGSNRAAAPIASATCRPSCSSTSAITTLAPSRANMRAVAAPMPDAAPEMMATFPASLIAVLLPVALSGVQRPVKFGRRFCANAHTASWWSLERLDWVSRLRLRSIIEWASWRSGMFMACLVQRIDRVAPPASRRASP